MKFKNLILLILEMIICFICCKYITISDNFNYFMLFIMFVFGFIYGMNKNVFKYFIPFIVSGSVILISNSDIHVLVYHCLIYSYLGMFISTFINMFINKKKFRRIFI